MKKLSAILLALSLLFTLCACGAQNDTPAVTTAPSDTPAFPDEPLKVGVLSGSTGMGIAQLMWEIENDPELASKYEVEVYAKPELLLPDVIAGKVDIATLPTNAAATVYNKTQGKVSVLALNTLGVLYIADNTGSVQTLSDLAGKTVHVATPAQTPEYILRYILEQNDLLDKVTLSYDYTDMDVLASELAKGSVELALLPEPKITAAKTQAKNTGNTALTVPLDMTAEWDKICSTPVTQGCVVAQNRVIETYPDAITAFLEDYSASISFISEEANLDEAVEMIVAAGVIPKAPIAKAALPKCNIVYQDGSEMKATFSAFLAVLHSMDKTAVGGAIPSDDFYYQK